MPQCNTCYIMCNMCYDTWAGVQVVPSRSDNPRDGLKAVLYRRGANQVGHGLQAVPRPA